MNRTLQRAALFVGLSTALLSTTAFAAAPADTCSVTLPAKTPRLSIGEKLEYDIDSMGATVGSFSLTLGPAPKPNAYTIIARGKTDSFAANFYAVDATAESYLGRALENRRYVEDATEAQVRRTVDVSFIPNTEQRLSVRATKQGTREDYTTPGPSETRDMLAALYTVRHLQLDDGEQICMPIFGARRVWMLRAKVNGRVKVKTPGGSFNTIHLKGTATRVDGPNQSREVEFWYSDDAARIPVAAMGLIQNKTVRAQLVNYTPGRSATAKGRKL
jgi:hypothetical protein